MALVIAGSIVAAIVLLFQGIHILRSGNMRPFFVESRDLGRAEPSLRSGPKYTAAGLHVVASAMIFCVLTLALLKNGTAPLFQWLTGHVGGVLGGLFLLTYGLLSFLWPDVVLRWVSSAYADYDVGRDIPSIRYFARGLGVCLVALGLYVFTRL